MWGSVFAETDPFAERSTARLSPETRAGLESTYRVFLGFLAAEAPDRLQLDPASRVEPALLDSFATYVRRTCRETTVATYIERLHFVLSRMLPDQDWSWIYLAFCRIKRDATPMAHRIITSEQLYLLGIALMDRASAEEFVADRTQNAMMFRDGLLIALLAAFPLRRRAFAALRIGKQVVKVGRFWELDIPAEDTKTRRPADCRLLTPLTTYLDTYLERFRPRIPGAADHDGLWASRYGRPLSGGGILEAVQRRTRAGLGYPVSLHRFRHAAATFLAIRDPKNVRVAKDLLGHTSFAMTEKHYVMAQSRMASQAYNDILALYDTNLARAA
jgi:integrase